MEKIVFKINFKKKKVISLREDFLKQVSVILVQFLPGQL